MTDLDIGSFVKDFKEQFKSALLKHSLYGVEDFDELLESLNLVCASLENNKEFFIPIKEHKIDKFGLAEMAVRFANSGKSYKDIAQTISLASGVAISETEIIEWFKTYSNLKLSKTKKVYGNIFDVQERMQEVYCKLMDHIELIQETEKSEFWKAKTTKQQLILDIYKEVRHLSKDATEVIKSINHYQKLEQFRMLVIETIRGIDPATAIIITEKLKQDAALFKTILPANI